MGRHRKIRTANDDGPYKCEFCTRYLLSKSDPAAAHWDWITGYLPKTVHCCPQCQRSYPKAWGKLLFDSRIKPQRKDAL